VPAAETPAAPGETPAVALGRRLFFDRSLSEPAGTSCASCHDPARAFAGGNQAAIGVARGSRPGHFARRNTPSVLYLKYVPRFHYYQEEDAPLPSAFGGFFWDGRADSIAALVRQPLTNPDEMNNRDARQIAGKLRAGGYAADFQRALGASLDDPEAALAALGRALEAFLTSPAMAPFASKYDAYVRGRAVFTAEEELGLKLFSNPDKGNCSSCHLLTVTSPTPERSMFTDYGYDAVAVAGHPHRPGARGPAGVGIGSRCRATASSRSRGTPMRSISGCASGPTSICPRATRSGARASARRRCATSRCGRRSCTTACSPTCATWSRSMRRAPPIRFAGTSRA
jgi:cytochrome c peroxidase